MNQLLELAAAVKAARKRTGINIGTCVEKGRFFVVNTAYAKNGKSTVVYLTAGLLFSDCVEFVNKYSG